jgi:hypothetical protein
MVLLGVLLLGSVVSAQAQMEKAVIARESQGTGHIPNITCQRNDARRRKTTRAAISFLVIQPLRLR